MPLKDYECKGCENTFEFLVIGKEKPKCPRCSSKAVKPKISAHGGYSMSSGGSSVRPKRAGSFKRS